MMLTSDVDDDNGDDDVDDDDDGDGDGDDDGDDDDDDDDDGDDSDDDVDGDDDGDGDDDVLRLTSFPEIQAVVAKHKTGYKKRLDAKNKLVPSNTCTAAVPVRTGKVL